MSTTAAPPTSDVQLEHGYTRIANRLLTAIALAPWDSPSQTAIVLALVRLTYGLRRKDAPIGMAQWRELTDLPDSSLRRVLPTLQRNGVIRCVADFDASSQRPKVWRLEKQSTKWGRFAVPEQRLTAAEASAGQALLEAMSPTPSSAHARAVLTDEQCSPVSSALRSHVSSALPPPVSGGSASGPYSRNGISGGKERERQVKKEPPPAVPPPAAARRTAQDELVGWLGKANTGALERFLEAHPRNRAAVGSILATFARPSLVGDGVWGALAEGDRPPILEEALDAFAGEGRQYQALGFRIVVEERVKRARNGNGRHDEAPADAPLTAAQMARYRAIRSELEKGGMQPDEAAVEAGERARRE